MKGGGKKCFLWISPLLSNACWLLTCRSVEVNSIWNMWLEGSMNWKYVYGAIAISLKAQFMFSVEGVARQIHWTAAKCALVRLRIKSSWWMMHTVVIFQNNENNQRQQDMIHGKWYSWQMFALHESWFTGIFPANCELLRFAMTSCLAQKCFA